MKQTIRPILLAEDNAEQALLVQIAFKQAGVPNPVRVIGDGREALAYLRGDPPFQDRRRYPLPALVITGLGLPGKSGFEILEWLQAQPDLATIPAVVLTASVDAADEERAYRLGAGAYVAKPSRVSDLIGTARAWAMFWLGGQVEERRVDTA